jgi:type VI secretion system protein ImpJ
MEINKPIYWYQGLFLQPHHFQLQDRRLEASFANLTHQLAPFYWGVGRLEIDDSELQNEVFSVKRGDFIFQDGTRVTVPTDGRIYARSFSKTGYKDGQALTVYMGLAKWNDTSGNVTEFDASKVHESGNTRFVCRTQPLDVTNQYQDGAAAQIRLMEYDIRVFWEDEVEAATDYFMIPVAQLCYDGKEVKFSDKFIPPVFAVSGSEALLQTMQDIREQLFTRCRQLEKYKIPLESRRSEISPGYILYVLILQSLSKYVPLLYHLTSVSNVHPWVVYGALRQLVGELGTFSDQIDVLGRFANKEEVVPPYDHENLGDCFEKAKVNITDLLHTILIVPEHVVPLKREESLFTAEIPQEALTGKNEYYLAVTLKEEAEDAIQTVEEFMKISSIDGIQTLIDRSLPGVPLTHSDRPLQVLPKSAGRHYFKIDSDHKQWREIRQKKNIAVHWLDAPEDADVEIFILS